MSLTLTTYANYLWQKISSDNRFGTVKSKSHCCSRQFTYKYLKQEGGYIYIFIQNDF